MTDVETLRQLLARVESAMTSVLEDGVWSHALNDEELALLAALLRAKIAETEHAND